MAFDAGAIVGRMKLDKTDFDNSAQQVENKVASLGKAVSEAGQHIYTVSRQIGVVGRNLAFFGTGVVAPMILAFKSAEKYSNSVRFEMERLNSVTIQMRTSVAESLVPTMHKLSNVMADLLSRWNAINPAMRQNILQTLFIAGAWMLLGSLAINVASNVGMLVGKLIEFGGWILRITKYVFALVPVFAIFSTFRLGGLVTDIGILAKNAGLAYPALMLIGTALASWKVGTAIGNIKGVSEALSGPNGIFTKMFLWFDKTGITEKVGNVTSKIGTAATKAAAPVKKMTDDLKSQFDTIKDLFSGLGKMEFKIPDKIYEASKTFAEGWHDAIEDANHSLHDWGAMAKSIVDQTTQEMQSAFSNLFQNVLKGQLNSAKDFFVEWGNFVLKIISDVIAQIITAKIVGAAMGLFNFGTSYTANIAGMGTVPVAPPNYYLGHDEGIERVPTTGTYKLHEGERVVPKYDANKSGVIQLTIQNYVTPEAIAAAMSGKEGRGVIVNVIDQNSLRNGVIRREVKTR